MKFKSNKVKKYNIHFANVFEMYIEETLFLFYFIIPGKMKELDRILNQRIENYVDKVQEFVDTEAAKAVSIFSSKTDFNERWLEDLSFKYELSDDITLDKLQKQKEDHIKKLGELEKRVDYYEKLFNEINEFILELEVKKKIHKNRQSRMINETSTT